MGCALSNNWKLTGISVDVPLISVAWGQQVRKQRRNDYLCTRGKAPSVQSITKNGCQQAVVG